MAGRRRRRSTRVRRHVPEALPTLAPTPRLAPPGRTVPAEDIALVRPYYAAHERLRARASTIRVPAPRSAEPASDANEVQHAFALVQERAAALLQQWKKDPDGHLLGEPAPRFGVVRPTEPARTRPARFAEWDELSSLIRT
ncbi:hypothetical protein KGD83_05065 [Nocardiopsis akebiae]|uniref:Uncharacterized protein n=1 Tax=Nocardiopsis akebiae TaxID=2831968 RepID=A0ABX8C6A2_9ACTN|nr:hypothetical protein KGD83_05065 [Nocardiopsis akebiae]